MTDAFPRLARLPPYPFTELNELKAQLRRDGRDLIDFGMANPDGPPPAAAVESAREAMGDPSQHRYSSSRGIGRLRRSLADWYRRGYGVYLDAENECLVTMGSKDGLVHGLSAYVAPGEVVMLPNPAYPIHRYAVLLAGGVVLDLPLISPEQLLEEIDRQCHRIWPKPKLLVVSFPNNPTAMTVEVSFFEKLVRLARKHGFFVLHDFAHAGLGFGGYRPPSFLEAPGARDVGVELTTLSKAFNMPGWRVGFAAGNRALIQALARVKSLLDYGIFQPVQIGACEALDRAESITPAIARMYEDRRDALVQGLGATGWDVETPRASMFVWARLPEPFSVGGSLPFARLMLRECGIAVAPGVGFGDAGEGYVRFALVEDIKRTRQATEWVRAFFSAHSSPGVGL
jgi:alanine-synthesizing transaminase